MIRELGTPAEAGGPRPAGDTAEPDGSGGAGIAHAGAAARAARPRVHCGRCCWPSRAAPIAIPLILVVVAMVLGLVVLILALVAGVAVGGVVAIGAGVFTACAGFSVLFSAGLPTMMFFCCGVGLLSSGVGLLLVAGGFLPGQAVSSTRHGGAAGPLAESKGGAGMNMPAKVCLGAGAFLVVAGGLLAITGFAAGAQTHLDLDPGAGHAKSETPVKDTGAPMWRRGRRCRPSPGWTWM
ncbi:MAG: hypothetical protein ACLRWQ_19620 [Flavonifractor plautii]